MGQGITNLGLTGGVREEDENEDQDRREEEEHAWRRSLHWAHSQWNKYEQCSHHQDHCHCTSAPPTLIHLLISFKNLIRPYGYDSWPINTPRGAPSIGHSPWRSNAMVGPILPKAILFHCG